MFRSHRENRCSTRHRSGPLCGRVRPPEKNKEKKIGQTSRTFNLTDRSKMAEAKYKPICVIGKGTFGTVSKVLRRSDGQVRCVFRGFVM